VILVAALSLLSAPAAQAAVHLKAGPPAHKGHASRQGQTQSSTTSPVHAPPKARATSGTASSKPAPAPRAGATGSGAGGHHYGTARSEPVPPKPKPKPSAHPSSSTGTVPSTWQREDTDHLDRGVVRAFTTDLKKAGQSAGFPAVLIAVMVIFLLVQHRLDKRDAKLSHADWASDHGLEFSAPATIRR
jgi:hypothetical protein